MRIKTAGLCLAAALACSSVAGAGVDLRARAGSMLAAMEGDAHRVAGLLQTARAAHATGPIRCVDGYLSQIDTDVRHGRDDVRTLHVALAKGDHRRARSAFLWLSTRREAARNASFAADTCLTPKLATDRDQTIVRVVRPKPPANTR